MIAWIDASVGIAGDMLLAALLDAGADLPQVHKAIAPLGIRPEQVALQTTQRGGFSAKQLRLDLPDSSHGMHWSELREQLHRAEMAPRARQRALAVFERLVHAEARIHGVDPDHVHLHEVGSLDAVLDIVGCCVALESLGVDRLYSTPLPMGTGTVHATHGAIPLPAPATLAVLKDFPVTTARWPGEWVTPTGAALVGTLCSSAVFPNMRPARQGFGAGTRDPDFVANVTRVVIGNGETHELDCVVELVANIDDATGESMAHTLALLLDEGALDAWATPIHMKKGRPGISLQALVRVGDADRFRVLILTHSTTLGVRQRAVHRQTLERVVTQVETSFGPIDIKVARHNGAVMHVKPEFEQTAAAAATHGVSIHEVQRAAMAAWSVLMDLKDLG